jgi:hypothetical protein
VANLDTDSLRLKRPPSDKRPVRPRGGAEGRWGGGQAGRRSASPVSRAFCLGLFFLHAELQDPQIEEQAKTNTKTGHPNKHVLKQQTEVQFVVFAYLGSGPLEALPQCPILWPPPVRPCSSELCLDLIRRM